MGGGPLVLPASPLPARAGSGTLCTHPARLSPVDGDDAAEDAGCGAQEEAISQGHGEPFLSLARGEKKKK